MHTFKGFGQEWILVARRVPDWKRDQTALQSLTGHPLNWVGYLNAEPFVWLILIGQVPDICSVYFKDSLKWSRFRHIGADFQNLLKSKQAEQKVSHPVLSSSDIQTLLEWWNIRIKFLSWFHGHVKTISLKHAFSEIIENWKNMCICRFYWFSYNNSD